MPELKTLDMILLAAAALFVLWEVYSLISSRGKIRLKAKVFGRPVALTLLAVLACLALWMRRADLGSLLVTGSALAVCFGLYLLLVTGFADNGLYFVGKFIPFAKIHYHSIERETDKGFSLRIYTGSKDYVLDFPIDQRELVLAYMAKGQIADFKTANGRKKA